MLDLLIKVEVCWIWPIYWRKMSSMSSSGPSRQGRPSKPFKTIITSVLILALLILSLPFKLKCDTSGNVIETVLMKRRKSIAFTSRMLFWHSRGLSTYENELIVIVEVVCEWPILTILDFDNPYLWCDALF